MHIAKPGMPGFFVGWHRLCGRFGYCDLAVVFAGPCVDPRVKPEDPTASIAFLACPKKKPGTWPGL
ncbi:hypothetical protein EMEDMD4_310127 [Sinorhizobium medicae]|uniref:Uncharacterized protein n=1 Tax=Sinorhizobium medicae TaxID=110321 RepID=A0A508WWL2_9HYPH|nr:hypothetical protein EMEDMD4_310127 [Sinorhizobium medicae]